VGAKGNPPLARRARWRAPDYSTGMMAVVVALTMCDQVGWVRALRRAALSWLSLQPVG
jgi:hypothetical protein